MLERKEQQHRYTCIMGHLVMQKQPLAANCATFVAHMQRQPPRRQLAIMPNPDMAAGTCLQCRSCNSHAQAVQQAFTHQPQKSCLKPSDVWM